MSAVTREWTALDADGLSDASLIASISNATTSQAEAAGQVSARMQDILSITILTTEGTGKTAASTQQLAALAQELKLSVAGFKLA